MYKVFFKERTVFLRDDFGKTFRNNYGLFYRFENKEQLVELLNVYNSLSTIQSLYLFHDDLDVLKKEFISCFKFIRAAGGLVFNDKGEFLVMKRNGIWDLPKGKAEKTESSAEAAIREVSEECGLKSIELKRSIIKTYHTYQLDNKSILKETEWFEMLTGRREKTIPQVQENITEIRWLKKSEISLILKNTYPSIVDVLIETGLIK